MSKERQDTAREPVDVSGEAEFMDTGVLYEERICVECGNDLACQGYRYCSDCLEELFPDKGSR